MDQEQDPGKETGAAAYGMLLGHDEGVDLEACCLLAEIHDPSYEEEKNTGLVGAFIIAHGMTPEAAEAAMMFFHPCPGLIVDCDRIREICAVENATVRIRWTDQTPDYMATMFEYGLLLDNPEKTLFSRTSWETFVDQSLIPVEQPCMTRDRIVRLMEFDLLTERAPDLRTLFFSNMIEQVETAVLETGAQSSVLDADPVAPTLVVCPGAKAEEGRSSSMHKALAGPLPLQGSLEPEGATTEPRFVSALAELRRLVPWMSEVVDAVEEDLWLSYSIRRPWTWVPPILMHGPSGCGKTHFSSLLAKALGLAYADVSLAGSTDNRMIEGTSLGWSSSRPSWPAVMMAQLGTANPFLFVDEIEKVDSSRNGDPRRTLLRMLDRRMAASYQDPGLGLPCDLSQISWMFAANQVDGLDTALVDRMRIIKVRAPSIDDLPMVVEGILAGIAEEFAVDPSLLPGIEEIWMPRIVESYKDKRSLRSISRDVRATITRRMISDAKEGRRIG